MRLSPRCRQRQQDGKGVQYQHQQCRDQPHHGFRVVRAEQFCEVERRARLGGYTGSLCIDIGLLHLQVGLYLCTEDLTGWRAALGLGGISLRRWTAWPGCRDEYIDLMAGVPQIADDFAASH
jgi:hypothetical protein